MATTLYKFEHEMSIRDNRGDKVIVQVEAHSRDDIYIDFPSGKSCDVDELPEEDQAKIRADVDELFAYKEANDHFEEVNRDKWYERSEDI